MRKSNNRLSSKGGVAPQRSLAMRSSLSKLSTISQPNLAGERSLSAASALSKVESTIQSKTSWENSSVPNDPSFTSASPGRCQKRSEERRVGKSVDLGGVRRTDKKE